MQALCSHVSIGASASFKDFDVAKVVIVKKIF